MAARFLSVGSSGAISGIVGGLLCLTILGKLPLSPQFFLVVIGVNVLISVNAAHVDWLAHLGGFTAGFAACALLDAAENLARYWLRCKFPEFVKSGIMAGFIGAALLYFAEGAPDGTDALLAPAAAIAGLLIAIKLADIVLVRPRGLAVMTAVTAALWGFLGFAAGTAAAGFLPLYCARLHAVPAGAATVCGQGVLWPALLAAAGFLGALFLLRTELRRGLKDAGFAATGFAAERRRRQGL